MMTESGNINIGQLRKIICTGKLPPFETTMTKDRILSRHCQGHWQRQRD
jgi:hypothetical protein